jgi:acetyl esterase/lipase
MATRHSGRVAVPALTVAIASCLAACTDTDDHSNVGASTPAVTTTTRASSPAALATTSTVASAEGTSIPTSPATANTMPPTSALASPTALTRVAGELAYATGSIAQRLDLYMPVEVPHPALVVFIHGGGWVTGDKRGPLPTTAVEFFVEQGYAVASVNYRLADEATFPAQLLDVKAAIRWLRANAGSYGFDPDRMVVVGESAGAHLASLLGVSAGEPQFDDPDLGNAGVSSAVSAVVDFYGPVDLLASPDQLDANAYCQQLGRQAGELDPAIEQLLGAPAADVPDLAGAANPLLYLSPDRDVPPFLILHGDRDCIVPYQASVALDAAIRDVAGPERSTLVIVPGSGHYLDFDFESQIPTVIDFLARTLSPSST